MANITQYLVDAFAEKVFEGNPAAVVPLQEWLSDDLMQNIAAENNLSETAFFVPIENNRFHIRWFTPTFEIDLCGHATLATAYVIFELLKSEYTTIVFESMSGPLLVSKEDEWVVLDFPAKTAVQTQDQALKTAFPNALQYAANNSFAMVEVDHEEEVIQMQPNFEAIKNVPQHGIIVTAASKKYDFVSRMFAPKIGINEDPVTGSAHCLLVPYWSEKLGKSNLFAKQVSRRGGVLRCQLLEDRVKMAGKAVLYAKSELLLEG